MSLPQSAELQVRGKILDWYKGPIYPNGFKRWDQFVKYCEQHQGKPFMMTLSHIDSVSKQISEKFVFGIMEVNHGDDLYVVAPDSFSPNFYNKEKTACGLQIFDSGLSLQRLFLTVGRAGCKMEDICFDTQKIESQMYDSFDIYVDETDVSNLSDQALKNLTTICQCVNKNFLPFTKERDFFQVKKEFKLLHVGLTYIVASKIEGVKKSLNKNNAHFYEELQERLI